MYGSCEWSGGSVVGSECVCEGLFGVCWGDGEVDLFIVVVPLCFSIIVVSLFSLFSTYTQLFTSILQLLPKRFNYLLFSF